jgi:hypothetical protein
MEEVVTVLTPFEVSFFTDIIACNGMMAGMGPEVTGGSGDYDFQWEPAFAVDDPTAQSPLFVASFPQSIAVVVTDSETGCTASDSLMFFPNVQVNATVELCNGAVWLSVDPGSMVYSWTAEGSDGNAIDMSGVTGNSFIATELGTYEVMTYYSGCNPITHQFTVIECSDPCDGFAADLPDYIACNGTLGGLGPQITGGSGEFSFQWEPESIFDDPTEQSVVISSDTALWVSVVVTDNQTGCMSTDSVSISPNNPIDQIKHLCSGQAILYVHPGSMVYNWSATDPEGSPIDMSGELYNGFSATQPGTYEVMTYYSGCNEITHTFTVEECPFPCANFHVNLSNDDFIACNGILSIGAQLTGGSGDHSYGWYPESAVSDPNAQSTEISSSFPLWVKVHVTDNLTGCGAIDSVFVSPNIPLNQVVELCSGMADLTLDPGSMVYSWTAEDPDGNPIDMSGVTGNSFLANMLGVYEVMTYYSGCNQVIHTFQVLACNFGDDVWPGDVNFDGIADNEDALWLGLAFDQTGPVRPDASLAWEGQPAPDWNFNFSQNNVNLKHADCDGNGVVNFADTIAISQNYGQTHGKTENGLVGSYPALWVEAVQDTVAPGQGIHATVHLGSASQPVDSLHGIAFTLTFNDMLVDDAAFSIDFSGNALGTVGSDVMTLQKLFLPDGEVDVAVTRTTRQNWGGYGPLATFHIVTTDNLSGIHELRIGVSGITAITAREFPVELASVPDTVIIDPDHVGIGEAFGSSLRVWPNPGSGIFRIEGLHGAELVEVMDATGRTISRRATNGPDALTIDLSEQPDGLYLLRLTGRDGVAVRRLVKTR